jgi:CrcB protein
MGEIYMEKWIAVGLGGALGAIGRYSISLLPVKTSFPWLTLITNLLGAFLIGCIVGVSTEKAWPETWNLFWKTGVCGGFTTFSTFSLEAWNLLENGKTMQGGAYILFSVMLCLLGAGLGRALGGRLGRV